MHDLNHGHIRIEQHTLGFEKDPIADDVIYYPPEPGLFADTATGIAVRSTCSSPII